MGVTWQETRNVREIISKKKTGLDMRSTYFTVKGNYFLGGKNFGNYCKHYMLFYLKLPHNGLRLLT